MAEHSKAMAESIAIDVDGDEEKFARLMDVYLCDEDSLLTQRAAWPVRKVFDQTPHLLLPYLSRMIEMLDEDHHMAVRRNNLSILAAINLPEPFWDNLYVTCFQILENPQIPIAIRVHAMQVLANIAQNIPDLIPELRLVIESHLTVGSPGFKSSAKKILAHLDRLNLDHRP